MKHWVLYSTPKNLFGPLLAQRFFIGYYSFIYYIILQHFVVVIKLLFIISHFACFLEEKT